jgi:hypothetical protein
MLFKPEFDSVSEVDEIFSPSPQPSPPRGRGGREPIFVLFKPEFDSVSQVDVPRTIHSVSPLSPWERARVRGFGLSSP